MVSQHPDTPQPVSSSEAQQKDQPASSRPGPQGVTKPEVKPYWYGSEVGSALDVVGLVGVEGAIRLFITPVQDDFTCFESLLSERLGDKVTDALADCLNEILTEAAATGVRLGAALGTIPMRGTFESWLCEAIREAGLGESQSRAILEFAAVVAGARK